jgi:hypothetical protein
MLSKIQHHITKTQEGDIQEIDEKLRELRGPSFGVEKLPLSQLRKDLLKQKVHISYPRLSLGFLGETQIKEYEGRKFSVPKFGVYNIDNPNLKIIIDKVQSGGKRFGFLKRKSPIKLQVYFDSEDLPKIFQDNLVRAVDPFTMKSFVGYSKSSFSNEPSFYYGGSRDESLIESYRGLESISLNSSFHGIIPEENRRRIESAQEMFESDIYLVAERTPDDWTINRHQRKITVDPIAIGILDDECYIVDHFDTSHLERYVMKEWTKD